VTEAERRGVVVSPGSVFAVDGGLDSFVRVPFTRPADELRTAVARLAEAWSTVGARSSTGTPRGGTPRTRVMVA
jgi:DNA-binding transcriptional MocR family regulator